MTRALCSRAEGRARAGECDPELANRTGGGIWASEIAIVSSTHARTEAADQLAPFNRRPQLPHADLGEVVGIDRRVGRSGRWSITARERDRAVPSWTGGSTLERSTGWLMRDPLERRSSTGTIETGADASRIPSAFRVLLARTCSSIAETHREASVYVYGSVATGQAEIGRSDVDLLTIGSTDEDMSAVSARLSEQFATLTRGVEVGYMQSSDLQGDDDEAYGNRVFLRHYCVWLAGPDHHRPVHDFPADRRAARGFNGDIARHRDRWYRDLTATRDPGMLARKVARKTLLAVAGLVSVHDGTWTTDRAAAAARWSEVDPAMREHLAALLRWCEPSPGSITAHDVDAMLVGAVDPIVDRFASKVGLWSA